MATAAKPEQPQWVEVAEGVAAIMLGVAVLIWSHLTLRVLLSLLGAYVLVAGILAIIAAVRAAEEHTSWWRLAIEGVLGILVGLLALLAPAFVGTVLLYLIALWALVAGIRHLVEARERGEALEGASGAVLLLFAVVVLLFTGPAILGVTWLIALFAILFGALMIARSLRPRAGAV